MLVTDFHTGVIAETLSDSLEPTLEYCLVSSGGFQDMTVLYLYGIWSLFTVESRKTHIYI